MQTSKVLYLVVHRGIFCLLTFNGDMNLIYWPSNFSTNRPYYDAIYPSVQYRLHRPTVILQLLFPQSCCQFQLFEIFFLTKFIPLLFMLQLYLKKNDQLLSDVVILLTMCSSNDCLKLIRKSDEPDGEY